MGVRITAKIPIGSSAHFCRIGTANAAVFPEPVFEPPMQSRPDRMGGMQEAWIEVGRFMAMTAKEATSHGETPRLANDVFVSRSRSAWMVVVGCFVGMWE